MDREPQSFGEGRKKPYTIACIPAYNEGKTIAKVILKARRYVDKVIVCDDGSTDMTAEIAEALGAEVIKHERNMSYGSDFIETQILSTLSKPNFK